MRRRVLIFLPSKKRAGCNVRQPFLRCWIATNASVRAVPRVLLGNVGLRNGIAAGEDQDLVYVQQLFVEVVHNGTTKFNRGNAGAASVTF